MRDRERARRAIRKADVRGRGNRPGADGGRRIAPRLATASAAAETRVGGAQELREQVAGHLEAIVAIGANVVDG